MEKKEATTALATLLALWMANVINAVVALMISAVIVLFTSSIAFWVLWLSAFIALYVIGRLRAIVHWWRIING